ncbi:hypothetical protein NBRC116492_10710 [Aurantivibrio infirmus]
MLIRCWGKNKEFFWGWEFFSTAKDGGSAENAGAIFCLICEPSANLLQVQQLYQIKKPSLKNQAGLFIWWGGVN